MSLSEFIYSFVPDNKNECNFRYRIVINRHDRPKIIIDNFHEVQYATGGYLIAVLRGICSNKCMEAMPHSKCLYQLVLFGLKTHVSIQAQLLGF